MTFAPFLYLFEVIIVGDRGGEDTTQIYYLVQAVVKDARKSKWYRYSLYKCAQECHGLYYGGGKEGTFFYDGDSQDLKLRVLFSSNDHARDFQNKVSFYGIDHKTFGDKLEMIEDIETLLLSTRPKSIFYKHYLATDNNDSPSMSLDDVIEADSNTQVSISSGLFCHLQAIENERVLIAFGSKWYKCHLISKSEKSGKYAEYKGHVDNFIYGSWNFHQLLDGLNTSDGIGVVIRFESMLGREEVQAKNGRFEHRYKVSVIVEFRSADLAAVFQPRVTDGTERLDDCKFRSFLYVTDPAVLKICLDRKCEAFDEQDRKCEAFEEQDRKCEAFDEQDPI
jgi:hypothetical protein